ncbi:MAG: NAD(P)-dependent glycerol-3-phosphate dehydrogenase [Verrucomicrobia bacterium]|nr:NAD(P)-dependent glycerol-3-phosphate dehydrogenase [Verrucomicrobiota bacterium]
MNIAVLGTGAWGTALARLLHQNQHAVTLWGHDAKHLADVQAAGCNERYLPGIDLPAALRFEADLQMAIRDQEVVVVAVPSKAFRAVTKSLQEFRGLVVSVTKGIEYETDLTMGVVAQANAPLARVAALSGPSLAMEVAREVPTAVVAASRELATAQQAQQLFHRPAFRVYTSTDMLGVELGGALKNVIAIAAGVGDGLGFGDNAKAALVTRGIVEMRRIGVACGAQAETFSGLSGLGDLTVTCFSRLSRNRGFGEQLGRGRSVSEILAITVTVAEGYPTALSAFQLAARLKVATPIINEVHAMLYSSKNVKEAVRDLTNRDSKAED